MILSLLIDNSILIVMSELKSEYLCTLECGLAEAQEIGNGPHGVRRIVPLTGGRVEGPKIKGDVLNFGADWVLVRPDGMIELDVRATVETDDGELVYAHYRGLVDQSTGYFRTMPIFETSSEKYSCLNKYLYVGLGRLENGKVIYDIHQIL